MKINFCNHFKSLVDKHGDREALVHVERNRRYTFSEFHLLTNRIANMIRETLGLGVGDRFINILKNDNMSLLHIPTIFKGAATGAFANFMDAEEEHLWQIDYSKPKVAFIENDLLDAYYDLLRERDITIVCMDPLQENRDGVLYFWDLVEAASDQNPDIELDDREHPVLIRFTGGTTGQGKPAVYCMDNWLGLRDSYYALPEKDWGPESRMLHIAPISHGSGMFFMPSFYAGSCNIVMADADLVRYCQVIEEEKVTHAFLVPTIMYRLLEMPEANERDLSSLTSLFYGAAPMSPSKLKLLQEKFGNIFIQVYGSTEHFAMTVSLSKAHHLINTPEDEKRLSSAGQVVPGIEVVVKDEEGNTLPVSEKGELWLRSRGVCMGYLDNPEKTAAEFVDGYWRSGDIGYIDEKGFVFIVDRMKDMIISGGFNVYAIEVEAVLNSHEAVMMSAVVGIPHEEWGEAVHAEVVLREGMQVEDQELIDYAKEHLGKYKGPKTIKIVDQLPMSVVGKVLRREVRQKYWEGGSRNVG